MLLLSLSVWARRTHNNSFREWIERMQFRRLKSTGLFLYYTNFNSPQTLIWFHPPKPLSLGGCDPALVDKQDEIHPPKGFTPHKCFGKCKDLRNLSRIMEDQTAALRALIYGYNFFSIMCGQNSIFSMLVRYGFV